MRVVPSGSNTDGLSPESENRLRSTRLNGTSVVAVIWSFSCFANHGSFPVIDRIVVSNQVIILTSEIRCKTSKYTYHPTSLTL